MKKDIMRKAFTLVELLIVIAIIAILFVVLISKVDFATDKSKTTGVQTDFRSFQMAFETVSRENAGFNTFGWDTGDLNANGKRDSYDEGDTNKDNIEDFGEVWTGHKVPGETFTKVFTLVKPGTTFETDGYDIDAISKLETAINANLDPKLHITIGTDGKITMANGAKDPWNKEYHGEYITNAEVDKKDQGAIVMYSDGANNEFGSEHTISNGVVTITVPGNNKAGKDDYAISTIYTFVNGYGEVKTTTSGFNKNQGNIKNETNEDDPSIDEPGVDDDVPEEPINKVDETLKLVASNPSGGINAYSWSQIQALSTANLTPEEYETFYGIRLGQMKDSKYMLVDFDNYGGFVFLINYAGSTDQYASQTTSNVGGYANSEIASVVNDVYDSLPSDMKNVIKEVTIKCNDVDDNTIHEYTCKLFLPSYKEFGGHTFDGSSDATSLTLEGDVFDFFVPKVSIESLRTGLPEYWILTRSVNTKAYNDAYYRVGNRENIACGSYTMNRWTIIPAFVIEDATDIEIHEKPDPLPAENPNGSLSSYSWAEIKALANAKLTPEEYKSKYGIELGQHKYGREQITSSDQAYTLLDFDNYGGFVFSMNLSKQMGKLTEENAFTNYLDMTEVQVIHNWYLNFTNDLQAVIKRVPITYYNNTSLKTEYAYSFIPSLNEWGADLTKVSDSHLSRVEQEGEPFEWLTTSEGRDFFINLWHTSSFDPIPTYWTRTQYSYSRYSVTSNYFYTINIDNNNISNRVIYNKYGTSDEWILGVFVVGGDCVENHYDNNNDNLCDGCNRPMCEIGLGHKDSDSNGLCDYCNIAYCYSGFHVADGSWHCMSCGDFMCSLGYGHNDSDRDGDCDACYKLWCSVGNPHVAINTSSDYNCKYCKKPMCELGFEHKASSSNWICYGCDQVMCSIGQGHSDYNKDSYCNGCNIIYCVDSKKCLDTNNDGKCEWCGEAAECAHKDVEPLDGYCDICNGVWCVKYKCRDDDTNGYCDWCNETFVCEHEDKIADGICDICKNSMCSFDLHIDGLYNESTDTWSNQDGRCDYCNLSMKLACQHHDGDIYEGFIEEYYNEYSSYPYIADGNDYNADGYCDLCGTHMCELGWYGYSKNGATCDYCGQALCEYSYGSTSNPHDSSLGWWHADTTSDGRCDGCNVGMCIFDDNHKDGTYDGYDGQPEDGYCDTCGEHICYLGWGHYDNDDDGYCDYCYTVDCWNTGIHVGDEYCEGCLETLCPNQDRSICEDYDSPYGVCDHCHVCIYGCYMDDDWDGYCDECNNPI